MEQRTEHGTKRKTLDKHRGLGGYRLHLRRLRYAGKSSLRSLKFVLTSGSAEVDKPFAQEVISDYEAQVGAMNISTWLKDPDHYSPVDFWLDTLRAGVVFAPSVSTLNDVLTRAGAIPTPDGRVAEEMLDKDPQFFYFYYMGHIQAGVYFAQKHTRQQDREQSA